MTREEAILISAYTGYMLLPTGHFDEVHKACEEAVGRPIFTHELAFSFVQEEIRTALRPRIFALVMDTFKEGADDARNQT